MMHRMKTESLSGPPGRKEAEASRIFGRHSSDIDTPWASLFNNYGPRPYLGGIGCTLTPIPQRESPALPTAQSIQNGWLTFSS